MEKAVTSIAIDPIYARANSGRRFMTASEDKLILHEKTFLSRSSSLFSNVDDPIEYLKILNFVYFFGGLECVAFLRDD
jgi:hypothetical protein